MRPGERSTVRPYAVISVPADRSANHRVSAAAAAGTVVIRASFARGATVAESVSDNEFICGRLVVVDRTGDVLMVDGRQFAPARI